MKKPRSIWTLDSETDPFMKGRIPQPFIWGCYNGKDYYEFETVPDVVDFIAHTPGIFYAHNGGKFDYHFLLDYLAPNTPVMIIHGRLAKCRLGMAELRDSMSILPIALAQYKKDDMDYSLMEAEVRDLPENRAKIRAYLKNDCIYLYELVSQFRAKYGGHLTLASASMAAWEKMRGIKIPDSGMHYYAHFKPWYFGGRVECRERGVFDGKFHLADINSAYPYAMLREHPIGIEYRTVTENRILGHGFYIVRCRANGCFPFRDANNKLMFPNFLTPPTKPSDAELAALILTRDIDDPEVIKSLGKVYYPSGNDMRNYHVTGWELLAALELKLIEDYEILQRIEFMETVNFTDYILGLYKTKREAKDNGDKATELFSKLMMNSLYGKFGANPATYRNRSLADPAVIGAGDDRYSSDGMMGKWAVVVDNKSISKSKYYNVATAASITGFERSYLLRALIQCAVTPLYMDTDCILARDFNGLPYGRDLGQWDNQGTYTQIALGGKKLYGFKGPDGVKIASKGARLSYDEIVRVARGDEIIWESIAPTFSLYRDVGFLERKVHIT